MSKSLKREVQRSTSRRTGNRLRVARQCVSVLGAASMVLGMLTLSIPVAVADTVPLNPASPSSPPTVSADALPTAQIDGVVWQQVLSGNTVYAAGNFTTARPAGAAPGTNTVPRLNIVAYDLGTGNLVTSFAPALNGEARTIAASPDGSRIYVGGSFTAVNGTPVARIAALDAKTGGLITTFKPQPNARVNALVATDTTVYAGGWFKAVGSAPRSQLAAFRAADGGLLPWNPITAGGGVEALAVSPDRTKVVVGGHFTSLNGSSNPGYGLGAVDAVTGALLPFAANGLIRDAGDTAAILSLSVDATNVYGTGYTFGPGNFEGAFSASWADGSIKWLQDCHGDTYGVFPGPNAVYVASHAHYCANVDSFPQTNPFTHYRAMAFSKEATGTVTKDRVGYFNFAGSPAPKVLNWFPNLDVGTFTGQYQGPWAVTGNDQYVVMGGEFRNVNGVPQQGLVRFALKELAPNKQGPVVVGAGANPSVISPASGTARINWQANWDRDNENLTYQVIRDGRIDQPISIQTRASTFWNRPGMSFTDTGLVPGSSHGYRIFAIDPFGNISRSETVNVTVASSGALSGYASSVLQDGALDYWRLGEPSGPAVVDWAGWNHLNAGSGVSRGSAGAIVGDPNTSSAFNGTINGEAISPSQVGPPDVFTAEAWFKTSSFSGGKILGFGNRNTGDSTSYDRHVYMDNLGRIWFGVHALGVRTLNTPTTYNDGKWHHVAATLDAAGMALFVDGQKIGQRADASFGQHFFGYWKVGGDSLGGWPSQPSSKYFNGTIDEVAIYPSVLSQQQIQNHIAWAKGSGNQLPVASFTSSAVNLAVAFDGSASSDADGSVASYSWDFGDGSPAGSGVKPSHTYAGAGTFQVKLTVTDDKGATASVTNAVTVSSANQLPVASFTSSAVNLAVAFDGSASSDADGSVASYSWDFGDGSPAGSGVKPSHTYAGAGTFQVKLTVTDDKGATASVTNAVTVSSANQLPVASFTSSAVNLAVAFDGSASSDADGSVASYSWDFGDGSPAGSGVKPSHTYAGAGTFQVKLTVTDDKGATASVTNAVTVMTAAENFIARDDFARTVASGFGSADVGGPWTVDTGAGAVYSVSNGFGKMLTQPATQPSAMLNAVSSSSTDVTVKFSLDKRADGGGYFVSLLGRRIGNGNDYRAKLWISSGGQVTLHMMKTVSGVESALTSTPLSGMTYAAGDELQIRLQVTGLSPTTMNAKVWRSTVAEPTGWTSSTTDATPALQTGGGLGLLGYLSKTATNGPVTASFSSLAARPVP